MRKYIVLVILLVTSGGYLFAQQDMLYSQYIFNGLAINPAYAGYKQALNIQAFTRLQWIGIDGAPRAYSAIVDGVAGEKKNVGWGGQISSETKGAANTISVYGTYAYRLSLNRRGDRLTMGLSAGLSYQNIDRNKLTPQELNDPTLEGIHGEARPDFRFGAYYDMPYFYAGISVTDIFANFTYAKRVPHMYLTVGGLIILSEAVKLKPAMMLREDFSGPTNADFNIFGIFADRVWLGVGYRTGVPFKGNLSSADKLLVTNAMSFLVQVYATESLSIGYSYDHNLNGFPATQEITIGYTFKSQNVRNKRYF